MIFMCDNNADRDFQELLRAATRGDVALDLPGGLWCNAVPASSLTEFRTPQTDAHMPFDPILGIDTTIETRLRGSIQFMDEAQSVSIGDSESDSSTQIYTKGPVYHSNSNIGYDVVSPAASNGQCYSDADHFSYQDLDPSSVSFHQDKPAVSLIGHDYLLHTPPFQMSSEGDPNPGGDFANVMPVHYDSRALASAMPSMPIQSGLEILTIPRQSAQLVVTSDHDYNSIEGTAIYAGSRVPVGEHAVNAQTETTIGGTYLEQTFGIDGVNSLPFENPSDPAIQTAPSPAVRPGRVFLQDLFVPYDKTKRTSQERSKGLLPPPTFFKCDDGSIGVPLRRAKNGDGLDSGANVQSPLGDRQTLQFKIIPHGSGAHDSQLSTARRKRAPIDLKRLMKLIANRTHKFLETYASQPDEVLLIGYTFVSKGAIMPILYFPSGWR